MNKQDLIGKIAKDTGSSKTAAAAAQGAHRSQPADRRGHQDPEAARGALQGGQGPEDRRPLGRVLPPPCIPVPSPGRGLLY